MAQISIMAGVGHSTHEDPLTAGKEAAERAMIQLKPSRPKLAVVFASSWLDAPSLMQGIRSVLSDVPLIGGSTAGEIVAEGPQSRSCAVLLLASESLSILLVPRQIRQWFRASKKTRYSALHFWDRAGS